LFVLFIAVETCQEKYKLSFGHQASYIIIIGIMVSFFIKAADDTDHVTHALHFSPDLFFYVCLPPIVFASGFNMHRGEFFANIKMVLIFGVVGTIISFTLFSLMTVALGEAVDMHVYDGKEHTWSPFKMGVKDIILMSSLLCSSDVIAAVSLVSYDKEPRLYSIIFGEGIMNDAVSIILFNTVLKYTEDNKGVELNAGSPFIIIGNFLLLGVVSLAIGTFYGFLSALFFKYFRSLTHSSINQAVIVFCFAYLAYDTSELLHESGIISLLVCGIVQAQYTYYNLSSMGQHASYTIFQFLSFIMEAFVFIYLSITFFHYGDFKWCPKLIVIELFVIMVGRFIAVVGLLGLLRLCCFDSKLTFR
jgi:NhaP-type Na+/H+ or K+/H+ antiporter